MDDPWAAVKAVEGGSGLRSLMDGTPGPETLKNCKDLMRAATCHLLDENADTTPTFSYGPQSGDLEFRQQLAAFLTQHYGHGVDSHQLMVTSGALPALHMLATLLLPPGCPVFMEDPTFYGAVFLLRQDLHMNVVPVPCDDDGMDTDALDRLLTAHRPKQDKRTTTKAHPFWAMVYALPVFSNPAGLSYTPSRCRRLVELARRHDVLVLAEDVYNLLHFGDSCPPKRLLAYDDPADPNYKGHVLSSGTFSKILAPGLRLGWVEGPEHILALLRESTLLWVGGSPNHYTSRVLAAALKMGLLTDHVKRVRTVYKKRAEAVCQVLKKNLPKGATFTEPQGGVFLWITFPEGSDTVAMMKWMAEKYCISVLPGICASPGKQYGNCVRVSVSYFEEKVLAELVDTVCKAAGQFLTGQSAGQRLSGQQAE